MCCQYREATTSSSSINAVICNANLARNENRLLVASNIDIQGHSRTTITPQETTVMPDINGLAPLLYLLFAPTVQLESGKLRGKPSRFTRVSKSKDGETIIKLIAGLGNSSTIIKCEKNCESSIIFFTKSLDLVSVRGPY